MKPGGKILAVLAGILFLAALAWALLSGGPAGHDGVPGLAAETAPSLSALPPASQPPHAAWGQPAPQGGANWIFDLFTPPVIYYDETTRTFTVTAPFADDEPVEAVFELELAGIRRVPYRFQLVSYAGERGNYVLTLEDRETGRDVFCSPGDILADQDLRVLDFEEKREVAASARAGTTEAFDLVGEAVVEDQRTGQRHNLQHTTLTYLKDPEARFTTVSGQTLYLATGDSWRSSTATYVVKSINLQEASATVEKTLPDVGDKVVKTLQSRESFNSSDLSNRKSRLSEPPPGSF